MSARRSLMALGFLSLVSATGAARAAVSIERISAPAVYIDLDRANDPSQRFDSSYVAFRVTNGDAVAYVNLVVTLGGFSGACLRLADREDGVVNTGPIAAGAAHAVYFYVTAAGYSASATSYTVSVYDERPLSSPIAVRSF